MGSLSGTNGKSKPEKKRGGAPAFRYLNHDLSQEQVAVLKAMDIAAEYPWSEVSPVVAAGYKFSLTLDMKNACYIASLTDKQPGSAYENVCLSGRGGSPEKAFAALLFRHRELSSGEWGVLEQEAEASGLEFG